MNGRIYLGGLTSAKNENHLRESIEPIKEFFDGLIYVFHSPADGGAEYLETNKKEGRIIYMNWCNRFHHSLNHLLVQSPLEEGDYFVLIDNMERLSVNFCKVELPSIISEMKRLNISVVSNFGKGLIYRYYETLEFKGNPHTYPVGFEGGVVNIQLSAESFSNVRHIHREKFHFIKHYANYMLYPRGSNHSLLGLESFGDPNILFPIREALRVDFLNELKRRGHPRTVDGVIEMFQREMDEELLKFVRLEKVWQDLYKHYILGDLSVIDDHVLLSFD